MTLFFVSIVDFEMSRGVDLKLFLSVTWSVVVEAASGLEAICYQYQLLRQLLVPTSLFLLMLLFAKLSPVSVEA